MVKKEGLFKNLRIRILKMRIILSSCKSKIRKNKKMLEEKLNIKIDIKKDRIELSGGELDEFVAEKVFEALELGFSINSALLLVDEEYMFETINIKDLSRKNPQVIRGRIIGTHGKTIDNLEELSDCKIVLKNNTAGIIGRAEDIERAMQALTSLIKGSKQSNVYHYLERLRKKKKFSKI